MGKYTVKLSEKLDYYESNSGFVPSTRTISTLAPLFGGGNLSTDLTLGIALTSSDITTALGYTPSNPALTYNIYGYVNTYSALPLGTTSSDPKIGDIVGVNTTTGIWILGTQRLKGFYKRSALTGVASTDYGTQPFIDFSGNLNTSTTFFNDNADPTKQLQFNISGFTTGNTRTFIFPDISDTIVSLTANQILTNKSISGSTNTLSNIGNSSLVNSSITINGSSVSLGGSIIVSAITTNPLTVSTGLQLNSGTTFDGSSPKTISIDSTVVTLTGSQVLSNKTGLISQWTNDSGYLTSSTGVTSVSGTINRITSSGGTTPIIDISASYIGQSSITTVGNLSSGSLTTGFTPITNALLANSTISGISLGNNLNTLTLGTDLSGTSYNGSANITTNVTSTLATVTGRGATTTTTLTSTGFIKTGGTSSQFLKADGTVDSTSYGLGSVTSVSVVTNQGVSGSVATATTTPAITLSLGALTGVTSFNGLIVTANTGVITTGTWNGTAITDGNIATPYIKADGTRPFTADFNMGNFKLGINTVPSASLHISKNESSTAYTTSGIGLRIDAATYIDTTSSGTVTNNYAHKIGIPTFNASSATTYTNAVTLFIDVPPTTGTNVTNTKQYALGLNGDLTMTGGNRTITGSNSIGINSNSGSTLTLTQASASRYGISTTGNHTLTNSTLSTGTTPLVTFTQVANTGGSAGILLVTGGASTSQTTATEVLDINFNLARVVKSVDGTIATQRAFLIQAPTYTPQTTALTITDAATLEVGTITAGSGTTITRNWNTRFKGSGMVGIGGSLYIGDSNVQTATVGLITLAAGTTTIGPIKLTAGTNKTTPVSGDIEFDGTYYYHTNSTAVRGTTVDIRTIVSGAATLTLATTSSHYVFTGTTSTWTLNATGTTNQYIFIKNRGSGNITLNSNAGGNDIYNTSAVSTLTISAGQSIKLINDGTYFLVE